MACHLQSRDAKGYEKGYEMKHLWCYLALACAMVCYVQRGLADPRWFKYLVGYLLFCVFILIAGVGCGGIAEWLSRHGWLP